ncbi:MAG: hypothetical protein M1834_003754 [Cirrosporium novae-zelandiae]|nr:MAG: hypothetical protein M1834_003754 [Cirrosporium novae-zelandiae]
MASTLQGGNFLLGQFLTIAKEPLGRPFKQWGEIVPNNGIVRYQMIFGNERIMLTSPQALSEVLVQRPYDFIKTEQVAFALTRLLGVGLLVSEGDVHKKQRKDFMPAFAYRHIKDLYPIFWSKSCELVTKIEETFQAQTSSSREKGISESNVIEISNFLSRAALDIIGAAGLGRDFHAIADPNTEPNTTYRRLFSQTKGAQILQLAGFFIPGPLISLLPVQRNNVIIEAVDIIRAWCRLLIEGKRGKLAANKKGDKTEKQDVDIIGAALESGHFTDNQLVDQMMTFLAAGHETTSTAGTWAIYYLCLHPEIQSRLRSEIREKLPSPHYTNDSAPPMTTQLLDSLSYLHAVCMETLRFQPPIAVTIRKARIDTTIQGHFIPANTHIHMVPYGLNLSCSLWGPDAHSYNPDRWIDPVTGKANSAGGASSNYAFLTFLHGPRSCIGKDFAVAELKALVAAMIGYGQWELADPNWEPTLTGRITTKPVGGIKVRVKKIEGW